ncbi:actin-interacting protein 1 [Patella vulgata]|uniref:actin-interacting protein 1 n=1 Tax=Patella vulgata TaxID=6465 RepID=UPI00217F8FD2|nr:actin-interacting protein 1 [Patella vulgata]
MSQAGIDATLKGTFATLPRTVRGRPIVINGDPKGKNFIYTNGNYVIIRDIENPEIADIYAEHAKETTVAKYAPSGFYIASADISGKVRIWDTTQKEHPLKNEFHSISGAIKDLSWSPDSLRICVAGEAKSEFAKVFHWDSGTSVGNLTGNVKSINSIDYRATRPFRIVTGSEDYNVGYFEGPPFKLKSYIKEHTNFVNTVRFSPDGEVFASGGADAMVYIYNGSTGDKVGQLGDKAHKGGVYALCFDSSSKKLLTVSADKTAKIWDVETTSVVTEFVMGDQVQDMQVGCLWQNDNILTVSLSGYINYLDVNNPSTPRRIIKGHNKSITSLALSSDKSTIFTGSFDSHINYMDAASCIDDELIGNGHANQVTDMVINEDTLTSISIDDTIRFSSVSSKSYGSSIKLESQPKSVDASGSISVVACINHLVVFENERKISSLPINYEALSVALHPGLTEVAVGGAVDNKLHIYELANGTLTEKIKIDMTGGIADLKYSPDGSMLATAGTDRKVRLFQLPNYLIMIDSNAHNARVNTVAWAPDSKHFASGSIDSQIGIWVAVGCSPPKNKLFKGHPMSQLNRVAWVDNNTLVSVAQDCMIKQWKISY